MTLQQLKYISMVEKCGSFSKAAQKLYVSQPSVSSLVHALEEELGITIFTRSSSGIAITNEGRQLLKLSNKLLRDADYIDEYFQRSAEGPKPSFFISSQHYDFVVSAFEEFVGGLDADRYTLGLNQNQTSVVIESVRKQSSDLGADVVIHSLTKYIGGHGDLLGGAVISNDEQFLRQCRLGTLMHFGAVIAPFTAFLVCR